MKIRIFKRKVAFVLCGLVIAIFMLLYLILNYQMPSSATISQSFDSLNADREGSYIENRLKDNVLSRRRQQEKIRHQNSKAQQSSGSNSNRNPLFQDPNNARRAGIGKCSLQPDVSPPIDINMLELYRETTFDNPDGGAWKQGWGIKINHDRWTDENRLKVFVVPHSHNDPGWIQTFEEYYERSTKSIFANMVRHLTDNETMRLIWAEISYFARWFDTLGKETQASVRKLVKQGRLEFVSGGWVMPDEANSHWYSIIEQLAEGQQWLKKNLNVTPVSSWSIDPFGHSPTLAYVLKNSGFENHLIQRTHYVIKRELAKKRHLEFNWQQIWDVDGSTSLFTHMMPFYSYDVPHTCGPDPKICCQFDFKRLPGYGLSCPWRVSPQAINQHNVATRAALIVDQWKKKAELYNTNSLLIPLGDDFRYTQSTEWEAQHSNFQQLFDYINSESNLNVEAKFGTLQEYFDSVKKDEKEFPSLSGDFFTYADRDDHYWSGYYTTRPFHKRMDRVLMNYIRSAEMLASWLPKWNPEFNIEEKLQDARRQHSLFQHHDGITGTAKDHVVIDYTERMQKAMRSCKEVMQQSVFKLLTQDSFYAADSKFDYFSFDDSRAADPEASRPTIIIGDDLPKKYVVLHNSLPYQRTELVEFYIARPYVIVTDADESLVFAQVAPVWSWYTGSHNIPQPQASTTKFRLMFKATVPPLGLAVYIIHAKNTAEVQSMGTSFTKTTIYTSMPFTVSMGESYPYAVDFSGPRNIVLREQDSNVAASFDKHGLLTSIVSEQGLNTSVTVDFAVYNTRKSGAYLFIPSRSAEPLPRTEPLVLVSRGNLESSVTTSLSVGLHETIIRDSSVEIRNRIDIRGMENTELIMRVSTPIDSSDTFYTDLNGLTFIKRENFDKIPLQANYYPIPTGIFIEDDNTRLTVLTGQPLGGSSLSSGQIEIMQDRRLSFDDERGLGQGIHDNRPVVQIFRIIVENRDKCRKLDDSYPGAFLSKTAFMERETLLHPMDKFIYNENEWAGMLPNFGNDHKSVQHGIELVTLKRLDDNSKGIIIHRTSLDMCEGSKNIDSEHETVSIQKMLGENFEGGIYRAPLTFIKKLHSLTTETIDLCPMETKAFILKTS